MIFNVILYLILNILVNLQTDSAKQLLQEGTPNKPLLITSFLGNIFTYIYPILFAIYLSTWYWGIGLFIAGLILGALFAVLLKKHMGIMQIATVNMTSFVIIPIIILFLSYTAFSNWEFKVYKVSLNQITAFLVSDYCNLSKCKL